MFTSRGPPTGLPTSAWGLQILRLQRHARSTWQPLLDALPWRSLQSATLDPSGAQLSRDVALTGFDAPVVFLDGRRDSIRAVVESEVAGHLAALALSALPRERVDWVQPPSSSSRGVAGALGSHGPDWTQYSLQTSTEAGLLMIPPPASMYVPGKGSCQGMPQEYETAVAPAAAAVRQPSQTPFQPRVRVETTSTAGAQAVTRFIFDL